MLLPTASIALLLLAGAAAPDSSEGWAPWSSAPPGNPPAKASTAPASQVSPANAASFAKDPASTAAPDASKSEEPKDEDSGRRLGGHHFLPSGTIQDPFASTQFASTVGGGLLAYKMGGDAYNFAIIGQELKYQVAISNYVALRVGAVGNAGAGVDMNSALALGEFLGYQLSAGATGGFQIGIFRLGLSCDASLGTQFFLSPAAAIAASLKANGVNASTLVHQFSQVRVAPGLQAAVGLHPAIGLLVHARYLHDSSTTSGTTTGSDSLEGGVGASFDLRPTTGVPVGLLALYDLTQKLGDSPSNKSTTNQFGGGLFYTGRKNLSLGFEGSASFEAVENGDTLDTYQAAFSMHYFW